MIIVHPVNSIQCNLQYTHTHTHSLHEYTDLFIRRFLCSKKKTKYFSLLLP